MTDRETEADIKTICLVLCRSGKFETGQGGCAPICMSVLGSSRGRHGGCPYTEEVHRDMAVGIQTALSMRATAR